MLLSYRYLSNTRGRQPIGRLCVMLLTIITILDLEIIYSFYHKLYRPGMASPSAGCLYLSHSILYYILNRKFPYTRLQLRG